jgi:hypothetical protein
MLPLGNYANTFADNFKLLSRQQGQSRIIERFRENGSAFYVTLVDKETA